MPQLAFPLEIKSLDEQGRFVGFASTYSNTDLAGDQVMPGAFDATLKSSKQRPLLWQHRDPIGVVTLRDSPTGLIAEGQLSMGVQLAKDAFTLCRDGAVKGLSIGFATVREEYKAGIRQLLECKLYEVSMTPIPCNEMAVISDIKSRQDQQTIRTALKSFRQEILDALHQ